MTGTGIAGAASYHPAADAPTWRCWICDAPVGGGALGMVCGATCAGDARWRGRFGVVAEGEGEWI